MANKKIFETNSWLESLYEVQKEWGLKLQNPLPGDAPDLIDCRKLSDFFEFNFLCKPKPI